MDKLKKFLELHVQWLAMAVGVAFVLWTVYAYVIVHPVTATVGPTADVPPGDIDQKIWEEKGKPLQDSVNSRDVPRNMPQVNDIVSQVQGELENSPAYAMAGPYTPLIPPLNTTAEQGPKIDIVQGADQVTELPIPPAVLDLKISGGHSNVPAPVSAGLNPPSGSPTTAPPVDKSWRTIMGRISVAELDKAFKKAKIPAKLYTTTVLRVQLIRQEEDNTGNFGPEEGVEIPPLASNAVNALPAPTASSDQQSDYQQWAETNYALLMQPPFYTVLHGDIWYLPGTKNPNEVQVQMVAFDPAAFAARNGDPSTLSPEDRKVWDAWKKAQQQAAAAARRAGQQHNSPSSPSPFNPGQSPGQGNNSGGNGNGGGRGGHGGKSGLADDPDRPPVNFSPPSFSPGAPPPGYNGQVPDHTTNPAADTAAVTAAAATLPHGAFDPSQQGDIIVWAHDETVQAGKTYRYKLRYVISNPVARSVGLCNPETLAQKYQLVSVDSAWSDKVSVESDTNFFAVSSNPNRSEVSFDVFHWKDGVWQIQTVKVTPGDMVGGLDRASKVDFTTGWTLVDVRTDERDESVTILLASDNGTLLKKDKNTDLHDAKYRKLLDEVKMHAEKDPSKTASAQP